MPRDRSLTGWIESLPEYIWARDAARLTGVAESKIKGVLDAAKVRRRIYPGMVKSKYHKGDILAMIEASVSVGPSAA